MVDETESTAALTMDRGLALGNSQDVFVRRALHVKVGNSLSEPIPVVTTTGTVGTVTINSNQISAVASSTTSTIINYTVPASHAFSVLNLNATGTGDGIYQVLINSAFIEEQRTAWTDRNARFDLKGFVLNAGDNIKLNVTNNNTNSEDYSGNLVGTFT